MNRHSSTVPAICRPGRIPESTCKNKCQNTMDPYDCTQKPEQEEHHGNRQASLNAG